MTERKLLKVQLPGLVWVPRLFSLEPQWTVEPDLQAIEKTIQSLLPSSTVKVTFLAQGACMAIEDAAALGILFNKKYFNGDIAQSLAVYEEVRLPRVTRVQAAAAKAAYNINERIGRLVPLAM